MDVFKVHAETKFSGSKLTLAFGPLLAPRSSKRPIFEIFGTLMTEYLQEKIFLGRVRSVLGRLVYICNMGVLGSSIW